MLTATRFERINGHIPTVSREGGKFFAQCECGCGRSPALLTASGPNERAALEKLLGEVLRHHGQIVMDRQNWACLECGRVVPLQAHHILARSHWRNDRVENLRGLCQVDHQKRHDGVRPADILGVDP